MNVVKVSLDSSFVLYLRNVNFFTFLFYDAWFFDKSASPLAQNRWAMEYKLEEYDNISRCLQCGSAIEYGGRADRKFCSPGCKNRYHNYRRSRRRDLAQRSIMGALEKNYEVLDKLIMMEVTSLDRVTLAYMGFDPAFSTSFCKLGRKSVYTCFDISYELTPTRIKRIKLLNPEETTSE